MTPDSLMLAALAAFALSVAGVIALCWLADREWRAEAARRSAREAAGRYRGVRVLRVWEGE